MKKRLFAASSVVIMALLFLSYGYSVKADGSKIKSQGVIAYEDQVFDAGELTAMEDYINYLKTEGYAEAYNKGFTDGEEIGQANAQVDEYIYYPDIYIERLEWHGYDSTAWADRDAKITMNTRGKKTAHIDKITITGSYARGHVLDNNTGRTLLQYGAGTYTDITIDITGVTNVRFRGYADYGKASSNDSVIMEGISIYN